MVKQGDVIIVSFDPTVGHEQKKTRPAVVVSGNDYNELCNLVWVCPISHAKEYPLHLELPPGLPVDGKVLCEQIRSLDIYNRGYKVICRVSDDFLNRILSIEKAILK